MLKFFALALLMCCTTSAYARDPEQVRLFRRDHPCPATMKTSGACPGYVVNHAIPLCWGGIDNPTNMEWEAQKTSYLRDKFEREACAMKKKQK